ncbi:MULTISPECIES: Cys-tRNA(Pro) deacylase [unclassified Gordonia (in: high G+C Gram-positive bacteria)]|uniref:Cys-tRNA(Pro) deacylase n=1 Tax=unclassified Gordonia (in: high G+C Gram-positive bacteria) TaxID=2657482 RepID=UPI001F0E9B9B|nr:Cys-tRNA(Pro) deacylase [Gordonia sp. ABSL49_1]MCH5645071.1 Cys-tRNA(Pro) deacylase [Gordonia sp. ABSL49_1]
MASTPAITALTRAGIDHTVHRYAHDPRTDAYGAEAVSALAELVGVDAEQILKTLVIEVSGSGARNHLAVAVIPVPRRLSLKAAAAALGGAKAAMATERDVTRTTGYVLGGVSPVGQRSALPTVIDISALDHSRVLCSAGKRGLEIELAPADLVTITGAVTADVVS